jgi:hypothetical protein
VADLSLARVSDGKQFEGDWQMKSVAGAAAIVAVIGVTFLAIQVRAASRPASLPVAYGFDGGSGWTHDQVKPRAIYFGAGGNLLVRGLSWVSWTQKAAAARGVRWSDSCVPSCAAGTYFKVPVEMSLSRVRARQGVSYFSRMILQWTVDGRRYKSVYDWTPGHVHGAPPFWS